MIQKQQIIISYFRQGHSQRQIARTMGISRRTVKRYILEYQEEKTGLEQTQTGVIKPPSYDTSSRYKPKLTLQVRNLIDDLLMKNDIKRMAGNFKQCLKGIDIHEALIEKGHQIGYTTVCNYIRQQRKKGQEIFIRQQAKPGCISEFDWGIAKLNIGGMQKNLMMAVFTLAFSNHRWAMLFYRQDMSSFLQAHVCYLNDLNAVPKQLVYDNMKTAVAKFTIKQSDKVATQDLLKLSSYYQFDYRFCNAAKGNEKGHVERSVEYIRRKAFARIDEFESLAEAQKHLDLILTKLNNKSVKGSSFSIVDNMKTEQKAMLPLPIVPYDYSIIQVGKLDKYHTICIDTNHYSVPEQVLGSVVEYKLLPNQIIIYDHNQKVVAQHNRLHAKHQWCINIDHYWKSLKTKPGAIRHSEAMNQSPIKLQELFFEHYKDIPKVFIELYLECKQSKVDLEQLFQATILTLKQSPHCPLTFDKVKWNIKYLINERDYSNEHQKDNNTMIDNSMSALIEKQCNQQLLDIQNFINSLN